MKPILKFEFRGTKFTGWIGPQTWLNELSAREAVRGRGSTINRFVCCLDGEDGGRGIRCFQRPKKRRHGPDEKEMSVLDCVSKLAYEVTMNSTAQNKS